MAIASTSAEAFLMSNKNNNSSKKLDFYESMYHFRKMFPKFDPDVIETVLRSNQGAVDRTIDQLLTMSSDFETYEPQSTSIVDMSEHFNSAEVLFSSNGAGVDLPPSYNEFMSNKISELKLVQNNDAKLKENSEMSAINNIMDQEIKFSTINSDINIAVNKSIEQPNEFQNNLKLSINNKSLMDTELPQLSKTTFATSNERRKQILIGDLPNDFLRIKLNSDQIKKLKTSIKKAKRSEITAILNNVSLEIILTL